MLFAFLAYLELETGLNPQSPAWKLFLAIDIN